MTEPMSGLGTADNGTRVDLRLHGGRVFLHGTGLVDADLLIHNGRIVGIVDPATTGPARETVDLHGADVLPGAIDPHVHLGKDIRTPKDPDDADRETASAVAGGITSMLVYLMSGAVRAGLRRLTEGDGGERPHRLRLPFRPRHPAAS